MRAESGPHQGDIVYREDQGSRPWLPAVAPPFVIDENGRPAVVVHSHKTGRHTMGLETGKWTEQKDVGVQVIKPTTKESGKDADEDEENANPFGERINLFNENRPTTT